VSLHLVVLVVGALLILSAWTMAFRAGPRSLGVAGGAGLVASGVAALWSAPHLSSLVLDAVSLPRVIVMGIAAAATFAVMPRRHAAPGTTASILLMIAAHLLLVLLPHGPIAGGVWVVACALSGAALPEGPARRVAAPYLTVAALAGLAGSALSGVVGSALLAVAVLIRLGIFPFHSWVLAAYARAPATVAAALVAPMSALGLVARTPLSFEGQGGLLAGLLVAAGLLSAGMALVQRSLVRAVAWLTVSVEAVVYLGVLDADSIGHLGGLVMWSVTGLALLGLGLVAAALSSRLGEVPADRHSGLIDRAPTFGALFLLFGLAAVGAPGTADFVSEDLVLHGALGEHPALLLLVISAISAQSYAVLHLFFRVFFGPARAQPVADARPRERLVLIGLGALLLLTGLIPQLLISRWIPAGVDGAASAEVAPPVNQGSRQ
jgi:hypothetical protein